MCVATDMIVEIHFIKLLT